MSSKKKAEAKKKQEAADAAGPFRLHPPAVQHCIVSFKPNLTELTFEGSILILMAVTEGTSVIMVNAADLIITKAIWEEDVTLNRQEPSEIIVEDRGVLNLVFEPSLLEQSGQLRLNFKGNMSDKKLAGFYVYNTAPIVHAAQEEIVGPDGNTVVQPPQQKLQLCLLTQFDPCEARRCFPCWDDPAFKITYDIIVIVPKGSVVLGPTPVKATYPHRRDKTLEIAEFKTTPKLSTHALGMAFGYFDFVERRCLDDEMLVRVYTPPGKTGDAEFALSMSCKAVQFFQEYFGCSLDSQKLDLVAVPDYIYSPIECWGLIFYRSADILMEPDTAVYDLMLISLAICHEISKQWFGNLVTHEWWSHQWLKEGFAAFAKYVFVDQMFPEMEVWSHFVTHVLHRALRIDANKLAHPVEVNVSSTAEIEEAVDEICLFKSAAILRMAHRFIGDLPFRQGLEIYLNRYKFGNTNSTDFWKCLQDASSKPVTTMMASWTQVRGYPLINVTGKQEGKTKTLKLTQERFHYDQSQKDMKGQSPTFVIPLTFSTRHHPTSAVVEHVMDTRSVSITIPDVSKNDWIKVNPGAIGYFRVKYPHEMYSALVFAIREKSLPALDRVNILDDSFALLMAGYNTTVEVLSLIEAFVEDEDFAVWTTISKVFDKFLRVFEHVGKADSFRSFGRYIYSQIYTKIGWSAEGEDDESLQRKLLRSLILRMMSKFNNHEVVEQCKLMFEGQFGEEGVAIPVDLKFVVYKSAVMHGNETDVKRFFRMYRETDSAEERDKLAYALGSARGTTQIQYVLDMCFSEEVRRAHTIFMMSAIAKTKMGREMAWTCFKDNFSVFRNRYGPHQASQLLEAILQDFATEEKIIEIQEYFKMNPYPGTEWAVQQISESIRLNELWLKREKNLTALTDYLEAMGP